MSSADPFARLIAADPAARFEPASPHSDEAWAIFNRVIADGPQGTEPAAGEQQPRRWVWALVALAAAIATAAAYVATRPVSEPSTVGCYLEAHLGSDVVVLAASIDTAAEELCRTVWEPGGEFAAETGLGVAQDGTAPPLAACVLDSGAIGVFPMIVGADVCTELGLAEPDAGSVEDNRAIIEMENAVVDRFLDACLDLATAEAVVESELASRDLSDWRVIESRPFGPERPCATLAIDASAKTVLLVFVDGG